MADLATMIERMMDRYNGNFDPDFQREHAWTMVQQSRCCEYILRGGVSEEIFISIVLAGIMETKREVLEWYLNFNAGGTVHSQEELDKVKKMIMECDEL